MSFSKSVCRVYHWLSINMFKSIEVASNKGANVIARMNGKGRWSRRVATEKVETSCLRIWLSMNTQPIMSIPDVS